MIRGRLTGMRSELDRELRENILPWWMRHSPDQEHGGFYGHITHDNRVRRDAPKGAIMHARILWTFSAAGRNSPDPRILGTANRACRYLLDRFLDREYGGVFWELDHRGGLRSSRKQVYAIAFTLYALAEYWMACGEDEALEVAKGLFHTLEKHARDRDRGGYTEAFTREWKPAGDMRLSEKDQNESKTMNTHLHILEAYANLFRIWKAPELEEALEKLIGLFTDRFVDPESFHLRLFFDDEWKLCSDLVSYGHDIECAWLLHEAATVLGKAEAVERTAGLAVDMARAVCGGLDGDGGLFYEYFPSDDRLDTDKHWWPQAEAMVGFFNAYQLSGDEGFARNALDSWAFITDKLIDRRHGEWYWSVSREGVPQTDREKAGFWKCPYHNGRACLEMVRRITETTNPT